MKTVSTKEAGAKLEELIRSAARSHEAIVIAGEDQSAVLVSQEDWRSIQETLYLLSVPGMRESLVEGLNTSVANCVDDNDLNRSRD